MADNRKYGINPLLISLITGLDISEIPENPAASMLPGSNRQIIAKKMSKIPREYPENVHRLVCTCCGYNGAYDLGLIMIDPQKYQSLSRDKYSEEEPESSDLLECFQATGYFRCRQCNAAGHWALPDRTKTAFYFGSMASLIFPSRDLSKQKFTYGVFALTDGSQHRWSTDAEKHYLNKLAEHPEDAFIWNRLANSYLKGGRPDLAAVALEESIKIDPGQMESCYSLGRMLFDAGEADMAERYIRQTLICAHRYDRMKAEDMRIMLTSSLQMFLDIHSHFEKFLSALPKAYDMLSSGETLDESGTIVFTDLTIYPDEPESFYPLAEMYMGKRRDELPPETQTLYQNTCVTVNATGKTPVLSGGKSKNKSGEKKKRKR